MAVKVINQHLRQADDVLGLVAKQADGLDMLDQRRFPQGQHLFRRICHGEQRLGGFIHPHIGRLR